MRMPIKLSRGPWPTWCTALLPSGVNPGGLVLADRRDGPADSGDARRWFSRHASGLVESGVWRSTSPGRHARAHAAIVRIPAAERRRILEVGASDGVTSLELIEALGGSFERLWVTDRRLTARFLRRRGDLYFFDEDDRCFLISRRMYMVHGQAGGWFPFGWLAARAVASAPAIHGVRAERLDLIQPDLRRLAERDPRVVIREYDLARPWDDEPADLIKVANLLNRAYFTPAALRGLLDHLAGALRVGGRLVVIDNRRGVEQASILRRTAGGFALEERIGGGAEATAAAVALDAPAGGRTAAGGALADPGADAAAGGRSPGSRGPADIAIWGRVPPPIGGMAVHVARLLPYLGRAGLRVRMYNLQRPGPAHPLVTGVSRWRALWYLRLLLGRSEPVHYVLGGRALTRFAAGLLGALRGKRVVLRVGGESLRRTGLVGGVLGRWATRFAVRHASAVIGVNAEICEVARALGARPERVHHIPGFIPPPAGAGAGEVPAAIRRFAEDHEPLLVSGGQIARRGEPDLYGVGHLLDLAERVRAQFPRAGLVFYAYQVRAGDEELWRDLAAEVVRRGLGAVVLVHPSQGEFWPVLRLADLMVRPTTTDGDSNAVREALFLGVPVVASDCAPRPAGTVLYPTGDAEGLARAVVDTLARPGSDLSSRGHEDAEGDAEVNAEGDAEGNAEAIVALLRSLLTAKA
jgi:glycosyltransferase involved in cell wall biosynthesis